LEEEEHRSSPPLEKKIDKLVSAVNEAQKERRIGDLLSLGEEFDRLDYSSGEWKKQAKRLNVEDWPHQNNQWKEKVGSHLFYPSRIDYYLSSQSTRHLAGRRDVLWSLAISACYRNPLAQYHLARRLDELHNEHSPVLRPDSIQNLYMYALDILEKSPHVPWACYILGQNYSSESSKVGLREFNLDRALEFHKEGSKHDSPAGHHNRVALLVKKTLYSSPEFSVPVKKDYLSIDKYGPAYVHAAYLSKKDKNKQNLLQKAAELGFPHAYLDLGFFYENRGMTKEAWEQYEKAGNAGVTRGYVLLSHRLIGDLTGRYETSVDLSKVSPEDLKRSVNYLKMAGKDGDVEGWEQLIGLYKRQYEHFKSKEDFEKLLSVLEKAFKMGSSYAYRQARIMFPNRYEHFIALYGPPTQSGILDYINQKIKFMVDEK